MFGKDEWRGAEIGEALVETEGDSELRGAFFEDWGVPDHLDVEKFFEGFEFDGMGE